eukprot:4436890-Amphidinium_carterae.1
MFHSAWLRGAAIKDGGPSAAPQDYAIGPMLLQCCNHPVILAWLPHATGDLLSFGDGEANCFTANKSLRCPCHAFRFSFRNLLPPKWGAIARSSLRL